MPIYFIDSSALVKRYRNEPGSNRVSALMKAADRLLISRLTIVEVSSALVRRARRSNSSAEDLDAALAIFDAHLEESFELVELDVPVMEDAVLVSRKHGLRGGRHPAGMRAGIEGGTRSINRFCSGFRRR
jgi:uncharacterized protein